MIWESLHDPGPAPDECGACWRNGPVYIVKLINGVCPQCSPGPDQENPDAYRGEAYTPSHVFEETRDRDN